MVSAHRHCRERHGQSLPAAARSQSTAHFHGSAADSRLEQGGGRRQGLLLQGSGRPQFGDHLLSIGQRKSEVATTKRPAFFGYRSYGNRGNGHRPQPTILSRHFGNEA